MIAKVAAAMRFNSPALGRLIRRPYATASATSLRMEFPALGDTDRSSGDATDTSGTFCTPARAPETLWRSQGAGGI
jgi:hypothetical protein